MPNVKPAKARVPDGAWAALGVHICSERRLYAAQLAPVVTHKLWAFRLRPRARTPHLREFAVVQETDTEFTLLSSTTPWTQMAPAGYQPAGYQPAGYQPFLCGTRVHVVAVSRDAGPVVVSRNAIVVSAHDTTDRRLQAVLRAFAPGTACLAYVQEHGSVDAVVTHNHDVTYTKHMLVQVFAAGNHTLTAEAGSGVVVSVLATGDACAHDRPTRVLVNGTFYTHVPAQLRLFKHLRRVAIAAGRTFTEADAHAACAVLNASLHARTDWLPCLLSLPATSRRWRSARQLHDATRMCESSVWLPGMHASEPDTSAAPSHTLHVLNLPSIWEDATLCAATGLSRKRVVAQHVPYESPREDWHAKVFAKLAAATDVVVTVPPKHDALHALLASVAASCRHVQIVAHTLDAYAVAFLAMRSAATDSAHFKMRLFRALQPWDDWRPVQRFQLPRGFARFVHVRHTCAMQKLYRAAGRCAVKTFRRSVRRAADLEEDFELAVLRKLVRRAELPTPLFETDHDAFMKTATA